MESQPSLVGEPFGYGRKRMDIRATEIGDRIPVSILTGFLGSGKTTVLNRLLRSPELANTVVIINEFGDVGLDHELVESTSEDLVLLQSGCLCCTIRGDLTETLRSLALRRRSDMLSFDRVVIETTGLADPIPILQTLIADALVAMDYRIDGVITTVDAATGSATLDRQEESLRQAAVADRIVLTKLDLVDSAQVEMLKQRLSGINPGAPVIPALHGAVKADQLFDAGLYNPATKTLDVQRWLNAAAFDETAHGHHGDEHHHHHHDRNRHDAHIKAVCFTLEKPISQEVLGLWLDTIMLFKGADVLRIKGMVNVENYPGPMVLHAAQHIFHTPLMLNAWPSADRRTRIVFIGRDLDERALNATFNIVADGASSPVFKPSPLPGGPSAFDEPMVGQR